MQSLEMIAELRRGCSKSRKVEILDFIEEAIRSRTMYLQKLTKEGARVVAGDPETAGFLCNTTNIDEKGKVGRSSLGTFDSTSKSLEPKQVFEGSERPLKQKSLKNTTLAPSAAEDGEGLFMLALT